MNNDGEIHLEIAQIKLFKFYEWKEEIVWSIET